MNNPDWTVERVRSELPDVRVVHNGRESFAVVRGRLLAFARLSTDEVPGSVECSWETLVLALNSNRPIII